MWVSNIGWEPNRGQWQRWLNEPDSAERIAEIRTKTVTEHVVIDRTTTETVVTTIPLPRDAGTSLDALAEYEDSDYQPPVRGQRRLNQRALAG